MDFDMTKDYYKILKVNVNANETEIKKAYRQLQMKHHPDRESSTENNDICSEINNAIATTYKGIRYILYDKAFMRLINSRTND